MPLSLAVSVERSIGTCACGVHGALSSTRIQHSDAVDQTRPSCSACQEIETQTLVLMVQESKIPRPPSRRVRKLSDKQARQVMEDLPGGRVMPASGALTGYKGDGRIRDRFRFEMKETFNLAFALTREILSKIRGECSGKEEPVVVLDFKEKSTGRTEERWCVIQYSTFKRFVDGSS